MPRANILSKERIIEAHSKTKSNRAAARFLGVSYNHYKRYARLYKDGDKTLFELHLNRQGKGIPKFLNKEGKIGNIYDVLEGRIPLEHFTPQRIRDKMIVEGLLKEECSRCGTHERRVTDYKMPLIMNWRDGNKKNMALTNLELVCYNCFFLFVHDLFTERQLIHLEDYKPVPTTQEVDWNNINPQFEEHMKRLSGLTALPEPGSEYVARKSKKLGF